MGETNGFVYIGADQSGLFKIGITTNKKQRLQALRTANPTFEFVAVFTAEHPAIVEVALHEKFYKKRAVGEWFSLSAADIKTILDEYTTAHVSLDEALACWKRYAE